MLRIYKASAGSGKTYTLTREYITLLLGYKKEDRWILRRQPEQAHRHILAITFTNKATQEMTRRIIRELAVLAHADPDTTEESSYLDYFTALFNTDASTIRSLAKKVLFDLLFDFGSYQVSTIDSFFQNVLRTFAREIEMPDNFELELNDTYTISLGVSEMLTSVNYLGSVDPIKRKESQWLSSWLENFMNSQLTSGGSINLFSRSSSMFGQLVTTFSALLDEDYKINSDLITGYLSDLNRVTAFEKALGSALAAREAQMAKAAESVLAYGDAPLLKETVRSYIEKLSSKQKTEALKKNTKTIIGALTDDNYCFKLAFFKKREPNMEYLALVRNCIALGLELERYRAITDKCRKSITTLGLLGCLLRYVQDFCKDNNLILLSETNTLLHDIINDDDTPFVYERMGIYLHNFLIDEFQDTSQMQWDNLRPLLSESLSTGNDDLIIGDEKQCIYRFRNSDPELLGHKVALQMPDNEIKGDHISENTNWRSSVEVVTFNNSLFHALAAVIDRASGINPDSRLSASFCYSGVVQQIPSKHSGFHGSVRAFTAPPNELETFALDNIAGEVARFLKAGYRPADIAILVKTHTEGSKIINRLLDTFSSPEWEYGSIDINSADSLKISASPAVSLIIDMMRLSLTPEIIEIYKSTPSGEIKTIKTENPEYRRTRLLQRYKYFLHSAPLDATGAVSPEDRAEALRRALLLMETPESLTEEQLRQRQADETRFAARSSIDSEKLLCPTLSLMVERLIRRYIEPSVLSREQVYLTAFKDIVLDFSARGTSDVRSFLEWWDRSGRNTPINVGGEDGSLTVMTIHASKGLEFPCVIVPFASWDMVNYHSLHKTNYKWFHLKPEYLPGISPDIVPPMIPFEFTADLSKIPAFADEAVEEESRQSVDNLNAAYVALTRAARNLTIYLRHPDECKDRDLSRFIHDALTSLTPEYVASEPSLADEARQWVRPLALDFDSSALELGTLAPPVVKKTSAPANVTECRIESYEPSVNQNIMASVSLDIPHFDFDDPRKRGDLLHSILSRVKHPDRLSVALRRMAYRVRLTPAQEAQCATILTRALAEPRARRWFEDYRKVLTERPLITPRPDVPRDNDRLTRRPDRIVWTDDGHIDIVDYKFGTQEKSHISQVAGYIKLMRDAGYENVRGFLWYPLDEQIIQVYDSHHATKLQ